MKKTLILCDFDGTITEADTTDVLLNMYASGGWEGIGRSYVKGDIDHAQMNLKFAQLLNASPSQVDECVKKIQPRDGFSTLISEMNYSNSSIIIVSSGWSYYIKRVLQKYEPYFLHDLNLRYQENRKGVPIISNTFSFDKSKKKWKLELLWNKYSCHLSAPCKGAILQSFRKDFDEIIAIGNSESDICMIKKADIAFAFGTLQQICKNEKIPAYNVADFHQIQKLIEKLRIKRD